MSSQRDWQELLAAWEDATSRDARRQQGSIWTPDPLASWMADWLLEINPQRVLDPGAGAGALLAPFDGRERTAADIDPGLRAVLTARYPDATVLDDFWQLRQPGSFDAITSNPPYINHAQLPNKQELHALIREHTGIVLPGTTNLAVLFLVWCSHLLRPGGRMIFLIPTEFMQTKSGVPFKELLVAIGDVVQIVDLVDGDLFGKEVASTACLVLMEKGAQQDGIVFSQHTGVPPFPTWKQQTASGRLLPSKQIDPSRRWRHDRRSRQQGVTQPLRELCRVQSGLITGNNKFFLRSWADLADAGLTDNALYCVVRPHQLVTPHFLTPAQVEDSKATSQQRWLLNIGPHPTAPEQAALDLGAADGVADRPTQQARDPWWQQDINTNWDFLLGNFRRTDYNVFAYTNPYAPDLLQPGPFAAIPNLMFMREDYRPLTNLLFAWLLSSSGQECLRDNERHAGKGLFTIRAGAIGDVRLPMLQDSPAAWQRKMLAAAIDVRATALANDETGLAASKEKLNRVAAEWPKQ